MDNNYYSSIHAFVPLITIIILNKNTVRCNSISILAEQNSNDCGYLGIQTGSSVIRFNVSEGFNISQSLFSEIRDKIGGGSLVISNEQCQIEICGKTNGTFKEDDIGRCDSLTRTEIPIRKYPYAKNFQITSLSCGCYKNRSDCTKTNCAVVEKAHLGNGRSYCAMLYQENYCQKCYYNAILLHHLDVFETKNSAAIKSILVRPGCRVQMDAVADPLIEYYFERNYFGSDEVIWPTFSRSGEKFNCTCPTPYEKTTQAPRIVEGETFGPSSALVPFKIGQNDVPNYISDIAQNPPPYPSSKESEIPRTDYSTLIIFTSCIGLLVIVVLTIIVIRSNWGQRTVDGKLKSKANTEIQPVDGQHLVQINSIQSSSLEVGIEDVIELHSNPKNIPPKLNLSTLTETDIQAFNNIGSSRDSTLSGEELSSTLATALTTDYNPEEHFDCANLQFDPSDPRSVIGEGAFGIVYKGSLPAKTAVAVKTVHPRNNIDRTTILSLLNEIKVHAYLSRGCACPNIVLFLGAGQGRLERGEVFSVLEICSLGNLHSYLVHQEQNLRTKFDEINNLTSPIPCTPYSFDPSSSQPEITKEQFNYLVKWSTEIAVGMAYLTFKGVVHIDLATRNVLLTADKTVKITDFGLSRLLYNKHYYKPSEDFIKPFKWVALESLENGKFSVASDLWAYGVTIWEIFSLGKEPYASIQSDTLMYYLQEGNRLKKPFYATEDIYDLMLKCWDKDPEQRPSFSNVLQFFKQILEFQNEICDC